MTKSKYFWFTLKHFVVHLFWFMQLFTVLVILYFDIRFAICGNKSNQNNCYTHCNLNVFQELFWEFEVDCSWKWCFTMSLQLEEDEESSSDTSCRGWPRSAYPHGSAGVAYTFTVTNNHLSVVICLFYHRQHVWYYMCGLNDNSKKGSWKHDIQLKGSFHLSSFVVFLSSCMKLHRVPKTQRIE